jgi:SAM-dependent methyltransferase
MRELPFADNTFDVVVNLFTSFGYFADDAEHLRVLRCVNAAMREGGTFVIDFFNANQVKEDLVPYDERVANGTAIEQRRTITPDERFVEKTITLRDRGREYVERVRLFSATDLSTMMQAAGFKVVDLVGDYTGARWTEDSPRVIIFGARQ